MGLLNARNLRRAKQLLDKNRHKVGDVVGKAAEKADKVSGGKTANFSKKAEDAARKYSAGSSSTHHGAHPNSVSDGHSPMSPEDAEIRRADAQAKAASALAGLAGAASGLMDKAQKMAQSKAEGSGRSDADADADADDGTMPPPPPGSVSTEYTHNPPPLPGS